MNSGILGRLKRLLGGSNSPAPVTKRSFSPSFNSSATAERLAKIEAADALVSAAHSKIGELKSQLDVAREKEASIAQALMARARAGEDTRQLVDSQRAAREEIASLTRSLASAQSELVAAEEARTKL